MKRIHELEAALSASVEREEKLKENLHQCHGKSVKYMSELAARRSQVKFLRKIWKSAKKVASCFPEKIPEGTDAVRFDIPAYVIDELRNALKEK